MKHSVKRRPDKQLRNCTLTGVALIVTSFLLLVTNLGVSQNADSLKQALKTAVNDSARCKIFEDWGLAMQDHNPDTAIVLYRSAIEIAQKATNDHKPGSRLHGVYVKHTAVCYNNIGIVYFNLSNVDSAAAYLNKGTSLLQTVNDKEAIADNYGNLSGFYFMSGNAASAIEYGKKSLEIREELKDTMALISSLNNLGYFCSATGNIEEGMSYYERCLKISEAKKDKNGIAMSLLNIAPILYKQGDKKVALDYFLRSLKLMEELNNHRWMASILANIGKIHNEAGDQTKAFSYYKRAIGSGEKAKARDILSMVYGSLGTIYLSKNKPDSALFYLTQGKEISIATSNKPGLSLALLGLSKLMFQKGDVSKSMEYGNQSLQLAQEITHPEYVAAAAEHLKRVYQKKGDAAGALKMYELFVQMRDSIQNEKVRKATLRTQMQYEYDKKESALKAQAEKDNLIAAQRNEKQRIVIWSVVAGLILALVFTIIISNRLRLTRSQKELIDKKNKENELLLGEIHHRVKNNLQVISSLLSLQERSIADETAKSAILEGKERVKSMELVHKMLYQGNKFSGIEMHTYINKLTSGLMESFGFSDDQVELKTEFKPITLDVDTVVPLGLILNELIVNSLKHAKTSTNKLSLLVSIQINENQELQIAIADNGKGKQSDIEKSDSFGLKIVRALIRQLDGLIKINDENGLNYNISIKNYKLIA